MSALVLIAASGHEQELLLFYAVAACELLVGLTAMPWFCLRDPRPATVYVSGAVAVAFTLAVNQAHG